jgi:hypothetical protein
MDSVIASTRNCVRISRVFAPIAWRSPILQAPDLKIVVAGSLQMMPLPP